MVYYFFAFSILGGTSWLLRVDNLETIMEYFSVCLWYLLVFVYGAQLKCLKL